MIYGIFLLISVILSLFYVFIWHKHFDMHFALIFSFVPISELGFFLVAISRNIDEAYAGMKIIYLGGCFLPLFITLSIFSLCKINVNRLLATLMYLLTCLVYSSVLTIGYLPWYYKDATFIVQNGVSVIIDKHYGFMHTVQYIMMGLYLLIGFVTILYCHFRKKDVSKSITSLLLLPEAISILGFWGGKIARNYFELLSPFYIFAQIVYLIIAFRICLYNVDDTLVDSIVETGDTGFLSLDFKRRYLGGNDTIKKIIPEIKDLEVDHKIGKDIPFSDTLNEWIQHFDNEDDRAQFYYETDDAIYKVDIRYLYVGKIKCGYHFFFTDDTDNQKYIKLMDQYNEELETEVENKTRNIVEMHNKLIMGMAKMVESRDNSTGGHIIRTSEGVRLLIDEIQKDNTYHLSDEFCRDIIKAAPMHDLGKVAVDDKILRKPGKFTPEEYEKMKEHAAEGAKIIHRILEGTDDAYFAQIAENVAHFHHEKWNGQGYPEGRKGEDIPLEARIMAIADVYDALVSKRVYKDKFSFEEADKIIMESMGSHFDPSLEKYYVAARPKFEAYYSSLKE